MQSTWNWLGVDWPQAGRLNRPRLRAVFFQSQMSPTPMVVAKVFLEHPLEVPLIEDDHVVQALTPYRPDLTLDVWVLAGRSFCRPDLFDV